MSCFGAVIVTYNPDVQILQSNLLTLSSQKFDCLVVDNGSDNVVEICELQNELSFKVLTLDKNYGIAYAQNRGFEFFKEKRAAWVLTLDQDSVVPATLLNGYLSTGVLDRADTGIVTAGYVDKTWNDSQRDSLIGTESLIEVNMAISSGNMVRISAWDRVCGFDEFLFIDMVDYDFDAKLGLLGYKIWQTNSVKFNHSIGSGVNKPILQRLLLIPKSSILSDHSAMRQFYIYRNTIIFQKRYPQLNRVRFPTLKALFATRRIIAYTHSFSKMLYAWNGVWNGYRYNVNQDQHFQNTIKKIKHNQDEEI